MSMHVSGHEKVMQRLGGKPGGRGAVLTIVLEGEEEGVKGTGGDAAIHG